jgi:hypothetical protein
MHILTTVQHDRQHMHAQHEQHKVPVARHASFAKATPPTNDASSQNQPSTLRTCSMAGRLLGTRVHRLRTSGTTSGASHCYCSVMATWSFVSRIHVARDGDNIDRDKCIGDKILSPIARHASPAKVPPGGCRQNYQIALEPVGQMPAGKRTQCVSLHQRLP